MPMYFRPTFVQMNTIWPFFAITHTILYISNLYRQLYIYYIISFLCINEHCITIGRVYLYRVFLKSMYFYYLFINNDIIYRDFSIYNNKAFYIFLIFRVDLINWDN